MKHGEENDQSDMVVVSKVVSPSPALTAGVKAVSYMLCSGVMLPRTVYHLFLFRGMC